MVKEDLKNNNPVWFNSFGWESNPFDTDAMPETLVFETEKNKIHQFLMGEFAVGLYGPSGSGKTTLLKWFEKYGADIFQPVYISFSGLENSTYPGTDLKDKQYLGFIHEFTKQAFKNDVFEQVRQWFFKKTLAEKLQEKYHKKQKKILLLLLNEVSSIYDTRIADTLRSLDEDEKLRCAFILTSIQKPSEQKNIVGSFRIGRIADEIEVSTLSNQQAREILEQRIKLVGGNKFVFSEDGLKKIAQRSRLARDILQNAAKVCMHKSEIKDVGSLITGEEVVTVLEGKPIPKKPEEIDVDSVSMGKIWDSLSTNHQKIITALVKESQSLNDLSKEIGLSYGSLAKESARLMLKTKADKKQMERKGITEPILVRTNDRPQKYALSDEWKAYKLEK